MSVAERRRQDVESSLGDLSLSPSSGKVRKQIPKQQTSTVADSWEEEASSGSESESDGQHHVDGFPNAPPPTPISPTSSAARGGWGQFESPYATALTSDSPSRSTFRPEKQTAVAGRMIAGALGVRAPKKTDEQRQYEKAMKEKELKRREKERDSKRMEEEDAQRAKAAIWES